jgi:hypothetical protein
MSNSISLHMSIFVCMSVDMLSSVSIYMPSAMSTTLHRDYCKQITMCYMPAVICQMLCALCQVPYASYYEFTVMSTYMSVSVSIVVCYMPNAICYMPLHMLDCNMQMLWPLLCLLVWIQNRLDISLYISITQLWFSILPLLRRNYYHTTMVSFHISNHCLIRFADISWHHSISQITVYFGLPTYQGRSITLITVYFSMPAYHGIIWSL